MFSQSNGDVIHTFGLTQGVRYLGSNPQQIFAVHSNEDGSSFVAAGLDNFTQFNGHAVNSKILKLTPNGYIDYSFDCSQTYNHRTNKIEELDNGSILISTDGSTAQNNGQLGLYMLNSDGSSSQYFNVGPIGFNGDVNDFAVQEDGKIIVVGDFFEFNGQPVGKVVRLNSNGSLDNSFNFNVSLVTSGYFGPRIECVAIDSLGRILIGGLFYGSIIRLSSSGLFQKSFYPNGERGLTMRREYNGNDYFGDGWVKDLVITDNNQIIAVGEFEAYGDEAYDLENIVRFYGSGSLDYNFLGSNAFSDTVHFIEKLGENNYYLTGGFTSFQDTTVGRACVLDLDGNLNTSFNNGSLFDGYVRSASVNSSGRIINGGDFEYYNNQYVGGFTSFSMDGLSHYNFNGFNGGVLGSKVFGDDIYVFGVFDNFRGQEINGLVKFNSQGVWDEEFNIGTGFNGIVKDITKLPNGDLIVVGNFTEYNNLSSKRIVKLHSNGDIDESFQNNIGFNDDVYNIELIEEENAILVSGAFTTYNNSSRKKIVKLNFEGSIIPSSLNSVMFNTQDGYINKIISFNSEFLVNLNIGGIKLIDSNGAQNQNFNNIYISNVTDIKITPDNKILVSSSTAPYIQRYNSDGTVDDTFLFASISLHPIGHTDSFFPTDVKALSIDEYGNIFAGGNFNYFEDRETGQLSPQNNFIVLNANGIKVDDFDIGEGFSSGQQVYTRVYTIGLFENKVFIGGDFIGYDSSLSSHLVSLSYDSQSLSNYEIPIITILGQPNVTIEVGSSYTDAGATATDNSGSDISTDIVTNGAVNSGVLGSYTITYDVTDENGNIASSVTRTVNVVDTTNPIITLNGQEEMTIEVGSTYIDLGALASDNYDGDITDSILTVNNVDANTIGTYIITFNVSDLSGNNADEVTRTVNVTSNLSVDENIKISLNIYPNPTRNIWKISSSIVPESIELYDVVGRKLFSVPLKSKDFEVNGSFLPNGIYFMVINGETIGRLIKN